MNTNILQLVLFLFWFIFLPGYVANKSLLKYKTFFVEDLSLAFATGIALFIPTAYFAYMYHLNIYSVIIYHLCFSYFIATLFFLILKPKITCHFDWSFCGLFILLALVTAISLHSLTHIGPNDLGSDYWYHVAQIRYLLDSDVVKNVFSYTTKEVGNYMYPYSFYYLLLAVCAKLTSISPLNIWIDLRIILSLTFFSATVLFFRLLLNSSHKAILSLYFFVLPFLFVPMISGVGGLTVLRYISYPKVCSLWIFFPLASAILLIFIRYNSKKTILLAAFIFITFQRFHLINFIYLIIIFIGWGMVSVLQKDTTEHRKVIKLAFYTLPIPALLFVLDYVSISNVKDILMFNDHYLNPEFYASASITELYKGIYITKLKYFFYFGAKYIQPWMVLSTIAVPTAIVLVKDSNKVFLFLFSFTFLSIGLAFNPIAATVMTKYGAPVLVRRFLFVFPCAYAFAFLLLRVYQIGKTFIEKRFKIKLSTRWVYTFIIILILLFPIITPKRNRKMLRPTVMMSCPSFYSDLEELQATLKESVPFQSVVLSDPKTSQILNALHWVTIVASTKHIHHAIIPNNQNHMERLNSFFSPLSSSQERKLIADHYMSNYIVVNRYQMERMYKKKIEIPIEEFYRTMSNTTFEVWQRGLLGR